MAEPPVDDLDLKPAGAGAIFRAEMFASNVLLGYWRVVVLGVVVVLLSILLFGQYRNYVRRSQRGTTAEVAQELAKLPASLPELASRIASGDPVEPLVLVSTAESISAIAASARGPARTEALLHVAELYRLAAAPDKQRIALAGAAESGEGVLGFAAEEALANLDLAENKGEDALGRLRRLSEGDGFLAEQATIDFGLALEHLDRKPEALDVYASFLTRWPDSPRKATVEERQARIGPTPSQTPAQEAPAPAPGGAG